MPLEKITEDRGEGENDCERLGLCVCVCLRLVSALIATCGVYLSLCVCCISVGGEGASWRGKSNPPRALHTSLFASQMFPQTLSVGCGPRRAESQYGFNRLVFGLCAYYNM